MQLSCINNSNNNINNSNNNGDIKKNKISQDDIGSIW